MAVGSNHWLVQRGYEGYIGWGEAEAEADFRATGGSGKETKSEAEKTQAAIFAAAERDAARETEWLEKNVLQNPFVFDEEFARQAATAEFEPYYTRLLDDYLKGVESKRGTIQGEVKYLGELKEYDTAERTIEYQKAIQKANQGWSGKGLASSGFRSRDIGQTTAGYQAKSREREGYFGEKADEYERQLGDIQRGEEERRRDIFGGDVARGGLAGLGPEEEGEFQTKVTGGINQRRDEERIGHYQPIEQAYYRAFPVEGQRIKGYLPAEYYQQLY